MVPVLREMSRAGVIAIRDAEYHGYEKTEYIALKRADAGAFSPNEVDLINDMIRYVCDEHTAASLRARCLIPGFDGALFSWDWKDAPWARFFTAAPRRRRRSVARYSIVKRA